MGSTASAFVCFVLPAAFEIKLWRLRQANAGSSAERNSAAPSICHCVAVWALLIGGVVIGVSSTVVIVQELLDGN